MKKLIIFSLLWVCASSLHAQTPTSGTNAIMEQTPRVEMTTVVGSTHTTVQSAIQYFDKLGRPSQTVLYRASPDAQKDILSSTTQDDAFGRAYKSILPTPSNVLTGAYNSTAQTLATTFYNNDANPFSETVFEASPANRPIKGFGAGQAWRTVNKSVGTSYLIADAGEVPLWNVSSTGASKVSSGYGAGQLLKTETTSEQGNKVVEYKDKDGNIVRKDVEYESGKFMRTLYLYDDFLRIRYVVQPNAYETLLTQTSFTESSTVYLEGIFSYKYDDLGRVTESHIVGAGTKRLVYDKNDRVVLENDDRDANILPANKNYYKFTKYDALGRKIQGGLIFGIGTFSRSQLQTDFDGFAGNTYETITNTGGLFGYTNTSFPSSYKPDNDNVKEVIYYDNYDIWQTDANYNFQAANAFHTQSNAKRLITGTLVRNIDTDFWMKNVNYYDYKGRIIEQFSLNHRNNLEKMDYQYRFNNEVLKLRIIHEGITEVSDYSYNHTGQKVGYRHTKDGVTQNVARYDLDDINRLKAKVFKPSGSTIGSKQTGNWTDATTWLSGFLPSVNDNVTINSGQVITIPSGQSGSAGVLNDKGLLRNFGTLSMGKITTSDLQTVDFSYKIRGGLHGVNLDASGNLTNKIFSFKLGYEEGIGGYFDGKIKSQSWSSAVDNLTRKYIFDYDGASRILSGTYSSGKAGENYSLENMTYDYNGNITSLWRKGMTQNNTFDYIDKLDYSYATNSNKINSVSDTVTGNLDTGDFRDGNKSGNDYDYWEDGSLKKDLNKGISSIDYNYLKLPKKVTYSNGNTLENQYDATGKKLKSISSDGITYDFLGNIIYKNNVLYQIAIDEGRIVNGQYEFDIKDHLGNLRLSFRDSLGIAKISTRLDYDPWGLTLKNLTYTNPTFNKNNFQLGSKEKIENFGLNWIDFGARFYMPDVPHFITIDPLAEKASNISMYSYAMNNPMNMIDKDGMYAVSVHYEITFRALIGLGYSKERADLIAHYSSTYADHPEKVPSFIDVTGHNIDPRKDRHLLYRLDKGINYDNTKDSQDERNSVWHSMMSDAEAAAGMTEEQAMSRGLSFGWENIFAQKDGDNLEKLGQGIHALQDAIAHQGAKTHNHLGKNMSSVKMLLNDMYGSTDLASSLTKSAFIVSNLLQGKKVDLKNGESLNLMGMSSNQFTQVVRLLIQQGFSGTIKTK